MTEPGGCVEGRVTAGPLLDAEQAGALLNVPASWILAEARHDRIPHIRLGRYVRFEADALNAWCKVRTRGPVSACDTDGATHDNRWAGDASTSPPVAQGG
jgi:excisionase family DNA binding protein